MSDSFSVIRLSYALPCQPDERWLPSRRDASTGQPHVKRRLRSALAASFLIVATGCTITVGHPPEASRSPAAGNRPIPSPSPRATGIPGAPGRIAVLDGRGTLTAFDADGSDAVVLAHSVPDETLVRQPTWSPDGAHIAWVGLAADGTSADIMTAAADGKRPTDTPVAAAPFYLSWDPTSSRLVYLGGSATADIELGLVDVGASTYAPIDAGNPFYFSWAPAGKQLLVHVGTDRLDRLAIDGTRTSLDDRPGTFTAPVWTADGRTLVYATQSGGGQRLVAYDLGTQRRDVLARFDGTIAFVVSPDGQRVAFQVLKGPTLVTPLSVIDRKTGTIDRVATEYSPAFFWSPDGDKLLSLLPELTPERLWFRWGVWEDGSSFTTGRFVPSLVFSRDYLQFFEQYAQSMSLWSPDGSAFVYAAESESGETGVWIQPATSDAAPVHLADGVFATWSPA
jgi:Tol biopolymer transport system component